MKNKKNIVVFGAGKIGKLVVNFLSHTDDYQIIVVDADKLSAKKAATHADSNSLLKNVEFEVADFGSEKDIERILHGQHYVLNCGPFFHNVFISKIAHKLKINYLDLSEDVKATTLIKELAKNSQSTFIPQCGLAPGFITIVTNHLVQQFEKVHSVKMRVGALPLFPNNRLKYNLTWSTDGLINEYCNSCEIIENGQLSTSAPLEGLESLYIDGLEYEAFNTSGGLGSFAASLVNKVTSLDYKTIRYPGHREIMCTLLHDLKFIDDREGLKKIFEKSLPHTLDDVVVIYVTVTGENSAKLTQKNYVKKIYNSKINGEHWGAIQITTAAGLCAVFDMHASNEISGTGFLKQEDISFEKFIVNRFGKYYN